MKAVFTKAPRFDGGVGGGAGIPSLTTLTLSAGVETERVDISVAALLIIYARLVETPL